MSEDGTSKKITIYIDDVPYQVSPDNNLLAGVLSNKLKLPYFCWHPSMGSVGACRQCAVTQYMDENDTRGRMVMSCMTPVMDGMRIGLNDHASAKFRQQVIAAMMTNHPHDCPVCAEGGECHLQDMTVMTGHTARHYKGEKRTFTNQYLGELVGHEMNRCITCYRCVRFYKDYAGGKDFDVFGSRNQVYFGRQKDGALESAFSGNLVEVCPTGVFTNKPFSAHYTRKWDLQSSPSVCTHCSVGCNTSIGERYGSVRRVMNRYNRGLNGYFLCDRGRFGVGFVNSSNRIRTIKGLCSKIGEPSIGAINEKSFAKTMAQYNKEAFIGIGSACASFEANRLLKELVGKENFSLGYSNLEMQLALRHKQLLTQYPQQSLAGIEKRSDNANHKKKNSEKEHDLVVIIGEKVEQTAPRLLLTLKQVLRNAAFDKADSIGVKHWQDSAVRTFAGDTTTPLFSLQAQPSELDQQANGALILSVEKIINCISRLTQMLSDDFINEVVIPLKPQPSKSKKTLSSDEVLSNDEERFLLLLANALSQAKMPLIVTGLSLKSPELLVVIDKLMACLSQKSHGFSPELTIVAPECNSVGNLHFLNEKTLSTEQVISYLSKKEDVGVVILEQELAQLTEQQLTQLRHQCKTMIVLSHTKNQLSDIADIVLPVATVSESNGHFVNFQGRIQSFTAALLPIKPIMESWQWLGLLAKHLFNRHELNFSNSSQLQSFFAKYGEPWALQVLTVKERSINHTKVARQTHRSSGRTAMMANQSVHEVKTFLENNQNQEAFNYSMEGGKASTNESMPYAWSPSWNSNQAILQHQEEVNGELEHQGYENILNLIIPSFFDESGTVAGKLEQVWPIHIEQSQSEFKLIQNLPWFLADQQSKNLPEFILMFAGNEIAIATDLAKELDIILDDIIKVSINGKLLFAKAVLSHKLPHSTLLVSLFELPILVNNITISPHEISKASDEEQQSFVQMESARRQSARQEKLAVLARLKKQDQNIPITFFTNDEQTNSLFANNLSENGGSTND